ncbi:hypothetical protein [Streptomyces sp. NPDC049555]|uniref:hypothetical protein n=1 Tax=Streptomyces sp. NPDC049555 TaxID=3154930 RepID=UPI0034140B7E
MHLRKVDQGLGADLPFAGFPDGQRELADAAGDPQPGFADVAFGGDLLDPEFGQIR